MKIRRLFIAGILLLFLIASVSAAENTTQDGSKIASENTQIELNENDDLNNIEVPEKIWKDGNNSISIETTQTSQIEISGAITYNATLNPGKTSIPIKLETGRHSIYISSQQYNITVLKENPHWNLDFDFIGEGEALYDWEFDHESTQAFLTIHNMPEGLTGNFTFYINGELQDEWNAQDRPEGEEYYDKYYDEKTYNFTVKYSGDDYFYPVSKSKILTLCPVGISIPEEVILGYDDTIRIDSDYDTRKGNVIIKVNNKEVFKKNNINTATYRLNQLKANQKYTIEVIYSSASYNKNKKVTVRTYDHIQDYVELIGKDKDFKDDFKYVYGDASNIYYITSPKLALTIAVDGKTVSSTYKGNRYAVNIANLKPGTHKISVSYKGDSKYAKKTFTGEFEVVARAKYSAEAIQSEGNNFTLQLPDDYAGNVTVDIKKPGESKYEFYTTVELNDSKAVTKLPADQFGDYQFKAYFTGNHELNEISGKYLVKDCAEWVFSNFWETYINDTKIMELKLPKDKTGNLTVEITKDGKAYQNRTVEVIAGGCSIVLPTDHIGKYSFKTSFKGNCELLPYNDSYDIYSHYWIYNIIGDLTYNSKEFISIELPENGVGNLTLEIKYNKTDNYTVYKSVELKNGKASIQFPTAYIGKLYYNVLYCGNYELYNTTDRELIVLPDYSFKNNKFSLIGDNKTNGTLRVYDWNHYTASVKVVNCTASIDMTNYLKQADDEAGISLFFKFDEDSEEYEIGYENIKPIYNIKLIANDLNMYYGDSKAFKVKVYRNNKLVGKDKIVTIKIGSKKYNVKTDKNGVANLKITQIPKKYTITVIYKNKSLKKKLTVKQVLTLKTSKVKKSARKLVLQATLKKGKTAIKGKFIKFKFAGKTYNAKTNKYGIAKTTIKKAVLNKLKAGKKTTYTATYIKTTVKKTVTVGR